MIRVFAPAKINLALHVTGQRADGYHLLDMLVGFANVGDVVTVAPSDTASLTISGPEAEGLSIGPNIITKVSDAFATSPLAITLQKNLPIASGIGGGSTDAAATYRAIGGGQDDSARLLQIGADVPMCVTCQPARVRGIGEDILPLPHLAELPVVLVNPRVQVATPAVFKSLTARDNPPLADLPKDLGNHARLIEYLLRQRNDLQAAAIGLAPIIATALAEIAQSGAQLSRMSGSGATCFGLYTSAERAQSAARDLALSHPDWWITAATLNGPIDISPQVIRATT
jgi:4-diphosphocytidyl-2-C-methyl-D-erythritol kinase